MSELKSIISKKIAKHIILNAGPLHEQYLFRWAVISPIVISVIIFVFTDHSICNFWNGPDQKTLVDNSKLPLLIAALSPILGSIISNLHRTVQTDKQIKEAGRKNLIDAYVAHQKSCLENLNHIRSSFQIELENLKDFTEVMKLDVTYEHIRLNLIYKDFFPKNSMEHGVLTYTPINKLDNINFIIRSVFEILIRDDVRSGFLKEAISWIKSKDYFEDSNVIFFERGAPKVKRELFKCQFESIHSEEVRSAKSLLITVVGYLTRALTHYNVKVIAINQDNKKHEIYELLQLDDYFLSYGESSNYAENCLLHLLNINIAMGLDCETKIIVGKIKFLGYVIRKLHGYTIEVSDE